MNIIDKFLYKFAMAFFLLFVLVGLDKFEIVSYESVRLALSDNFNFLKLANTINGKTQLVMLDTEDVISVSGSLHRVEKIKDGKKIILDSYEAVENLTLGQVVKIIGKDVYIQTVDDYIYCYKNLVNVDVNLYEIVRKNEIIGLASTDSDGINYYTLYTYKDSKIVDLDI